MMPALYLIHCGFYDDELGGIYESHFNLFVVADSFEEARAKAKQSHEFKLRRMHIDGIQLVSSVQGWRVDLKADPMMDQKSVIIARTHRELAQNRET